jgi:erythrocyte band 7 integral membrane protein
LEPGEYFENVLMNEKIIPVSKKIIVKELHPVSIVTKDTVTIETFSVLMYQIVDPIRATFDVEDVDKAIRECIKTVTHQVLSEYDLDYVMNEKIKLNVLIRQRVEEDCKHWGVEIHRVDIKDITFGDELREALMASAKAKRLADSKLIIARAEVESAELMRQTAELLSSDAAREIRQLETLREVCKSGNAKIILMPQLGFSGSNTSGLSQNVKDDCMGRILSHSIIAE